ncbi:N-acyl-D-amino-acid deacylase family protein [Kiritimatiella glycovorans]|nr:D-aminoacylase [Kiritimatiella glycovorans]
MDFDLLIAGGRVIDGTGGASFRGDVGIRGDRITSIAPDLSAANAAQKIDASGRQICPGLIDAHSHSDTYLLLDPRAASKVFQGVTTEVTGNCGASAAPLGPRAELPSDWASHEYPGRWSTVAEYRTLLESVRPAVNAVLLVGHNTLRKGICGPEPAEASPEQLAALRDALVQAMDEGAHGMSTGLIYPPGSGVPAEEIVELAREAGKHGGVYASHMRNEGAGVAESVAETIAVGRESGARIQISHLKASGRANWDRLEPVIEAVRAAREEGLVVCADRYPYLAGQTDLDVVLPAWAGYGGREAVLARIRDAATRNRILEELESSRAPEDWACVAVGSTVVPEFESFRGRPLPEVAEQLNMTPAGAALHLIDREELRTGALFFGLSAENLTRVYREPWVMIGSDASIRAPDGPLSGDHPHPRAYGSFTRVLKNARDGTWFTPEEAVRRMTSLPAEQFGLRGRGVLREGAFADIAVFSPAELDDPADYARPHRLARGTAAVVVNGVLTLIDGQWTGNRAGRVL